MANPIKSKVYLSGGHRSGWQDFVKKRFGDSFVFFDPSKHGLKASDQYAAWDLHHINKCDILFCYMEESNPSGYGLALEVGYAKALGKTLILVDERSSSNENDSFSNYFLIVRNTVDVLFEDLQSGIDYLESFSFKKSG